MGTVLPYSHDVSLSLSLSLSLTLSHTPFQQPPHHHRLALPSKSLPISGQESVTSDLTTTNSQGSGNYGAIGIGRPANQIRRSSVPTNPQSRQPHRKTSYGEFKQQIENGEIVLVFSTLYDSVDL